MSFRLFLMFNWILISATGCGGPSYPKPKTVPVSGVVYLDGKPVSGADVHFLGETTNGYGKTDAQGRYELVQGASPGPNKVYFSKIKEGSIKLDPEQGIDEEQLRAMAAASGQAIDPNIGGELFPPTLSDPTQTKITTDVPAEGTDSADFRLSSSG